MASTYSPNLRLELIGTGEQQGTWGTTTNTNLGTLLEEAIGGYASITVSDVGDTTLTTVNGGADQSRNMTLNFTGALTAARNVIAPAIEKVYLVKNSTTGGFAVTFKVSGQTGVSIPNGTTAMVYVDGTDVRYLTGSFASYGPVAITSAANTFTTGQKFQEITTGRAIEVISSTSNTAGYIGTDSAAAGAETRLTITSNRGGTSAGIDFQTTPSGTATTQMSISRDGNVGIGTNARVVSGYRSLGLSGTSGSFIDLYAGSTRHATFGGDATVVSIGSISAVPFTIATNNTERVNISSAGDVLITSNSLSVGNADTTITRSSAGVIAVEGGIVPKENRANSFTANQAIQASGGNTQLNLYADGFSSLYQSTTWGASSLSNILRTFSYGGTQASPTVVATNTQLGYLDFRGYDGSTTLAAVRINAFTEGTPASNVMPGVLTFSTTATSTLQERMRIESNGNVGIGTTSASAKLEVIGQTIAFRDSKTANTNSSVRIFSGAYTGNLATVITFNGQSGSNDVSIGGNTGVGEPATVIRFLTGSAGATGSGTDRMRVTSTGTVQISSNLLMPWQGNITTKSTTATLTSAELATGILNTTGTSYTVTLPTGTNIEAAADWSATNVCLDWWVINTASGTITIGANSNTTLGSLTVATGTSAHFRIRRTAANTFTIYRLS